MCRAGVISATRTGAASISCREIQSRYVVTTTALHVLVAVFLEVFLRAAAVALEGLSVFSTRVLSPAKAAAGGVLLVKLLLVGQVGQHVGGREHEGRSASFTGRLTSALALTFPLEVVLPLEVFLDFVAELPDRTASETSPLLASPAILQEDELCSLVVGHTFNARLRNNFHSTVTGGP